MRETERRREAILKIISGSPIRSQAGLMQALKKLGFNASQASLSRDLSALGVIKVKGRYTLVSRDKGLDPREAKIIENLVSFQASGRNLVVVHTPPGEASAVALAIDNMGLPGVVGTVAGDDTVFIALKDYKDQKFMMKWLEKRSVSM